MYNPKSLLSAVLFLLFGTAWRDFRRKDLICVGNDVQEILVLAGTPQL